MKKITALLFFITLFSCEENNIVIENEDNLLIGNWTHTSYENNKTTFSRSNSLPADKYGVSFKANGNYLEKTSGFCGTPPLSFFDISGHYEIEEGLITITKERYSPFSGWRIISLTPATLTIERELTAQEIDHRKLMDLFSEIQNLSYSESCSNTTNWTFIGYGSKACGGSQGYIPYSKNIDTVSFLKKIENYTKTEKEFNIKWAIISDCALIREPKSVVCQNGYPTLKY